jgi:putative membrane protein
MNWMIYLATATAVAVAPPALAQTTGGQGTNQGTPQQQAPAGMPTGMNAAVPTDKEFVMATAIANRFEIMEAELALSQATDVKLKEFARMMVTDHSAALKELEAAAKAAGQPMPSDVALDASHQAKLNALKPRKGADFDQAYRNDQKQAHQEAIALLEAYQRGGTKEPLRAWAAKALPVVKKHLAALNGM